MGEWIHAAGDFISRLWTEYHIGTAFALISAAMVFMVDAKLVKQFLQAGNRLREWPKLAGHTLWRVLVTIATYYGPVWTLRMIGRLIQRLAKLVYDLFMLITSAPRFVVILITTSLVVIVFLAATGVALYQYYEPKMRAWLLLRKIKQKNSLLYRLITREKEEQRKREVAALESELQRLPSGLPDADYEDDAED